MPRRNFDSSNRSTQGSFQRRMCGKVFLETDVRNRMGYFDGCAQQTFLGVTDARKAKGRSRIDSIHIPNARNPFNP